MPLQPQFVLQLHAFYVCDLPHTLVGEDHVGDGDKQHEDPHGRRQEFAVSHRLDARGMKRLHDFVVSVKADEPEENDADIQADVKEHGRAPAHEHGQLPGTQPRVAENLERKSQAHEKVGDHNVLEVNDETLGAGHVEEDPS